MISTAVSKPRTRLVAGSSLVFVANVPFLEKKEELGTQYASTERPNKMASARSGSRAAWILAHAGSARRRKLLPIDCDLSTRNATPTEPDQSCRDKLREERNVSPRHAARRFSRDSSRAADTGTHHKPGTPGIARASSPGSRPNSARISSFVFRLFPFDLIFRSACGVGSFSTRSIAMGVFAGANVRRKRGKNCAGSNKTHTSKPSSAPYRLM